MSAGFEFPHPKLSTKSQEAKKPTYRFELNLDPSEKGYAEYNYLELVAARVKEDNESKEGNTFSPKNTKIMRHDTTDPFIDDSELFHESVDTSAHSFSINCCDDKNNISICPEKLNVKKPEISFALNTQSKLLKPTKRRSRSLPPRTRETKKNKSCSFCKDVGENFKLPISHAKEFVNKPYVKYPLPLNLSEDLKKCLNVLKESIESNRENKNIKWNDDIKTLLANIEENLLNCKKKVRSDIYLHLAHYFSLSPNTLKKKSKALLIRKLNNDIEKIIISLTEEIKTLKTCDISSPKEVSATSECSCINRSEDYKKSKSESEVKSTVKPLDSFDKSNIMKKFVTPVIKDYLKTLFCYKRKLYEVKNIKKKHFFDELRKYTREDLIFMWPALHRPIQILLDFTEEFCFFECYDEKLQ